MVWSAQRCKGEAEGKNGPSSSECCCAMLPTFGWRNAWRWLWTNFPVSLKKGFSVHTPQGFEDCLCIGSGDSLVAQMVKRLPATQGTWVQSLGQEDPLEKEMAAHSSTHARKIPWMEKPGRPQPMGSQRVGHDWATSLSLCVGSALGLGGKNPNITSLSEIPRSSRPGQMWIAMLSNMEDTSHTWLLTSNFIKNQIKFLSYTSHISHAQHTPLYLYQKTNKQNN